MFRLSVIHIRIAIFAVNLALMGMLVGMPVYRVFNPHPDIDSIRVKVLTADQPSKFLPPKQAENLAAGRNLIPLLTSAASSIKRREEAPPPPVVADDKKEAETPKASVEEGQLDPGPLEGKWRYVSGICVDWDPAANLAVLEREDPSAAGGPGASKASKTLSSRIRSGTPLRTRTPGSVSGGAARPATTAPDNIKSLKVYQRWVVDETEGLVIRAVKITPSEFVYEVEPRWEVHYALRREEVSIARVNKEGSLDIVPEKSEEEKAAEEEAKAKEEEKKFLVGVEVPTDEELFLKRKETYKPGAAAAGGAKDDGAAKGKSATPPTAGSVKNGSAKSNSAKGSSSGRSGAPPRSSGAKVEKPSAEDMKQLDETLKQLKPEDRKKFDEAMKKAAEDQN